MRLRSPGFLTIDEPRRLGITLVLPSMIIVFGFLLFPFCYSLVLSLLNYDLARPQDNGFVGLRNYGRLLQDRYFLNAVVQTAVFSSVSVVLEILLGVGIALVMNRDFPGRSLLRALIIIPWALPSIVNASMWSWILNANYGALNALLTQVGLLHAYKPWIAEPGWAMATLILANVWKETPFTVILVLAALQGVPKELREAAVVDGAGAVRRFFAITLPMIAQIVMICALLQMIWSLLHTFELVYVVTRGGPFNSTDIIPMRIYWQTFKGLRFGYGAAMAYLAALALLVPSLFYIRSAYRATVE
ncbi:MAG TPA: sugar ABC transporter permease [Spirochaetia bacterium]|nr:sugar ABC transporter permease [Spirochaetia bacterium]